MLNKLYAVAVKSSICEAVIAHVPRNLRQYYANRVMYMKVCVEYGVECIL